MGTLIFWKGPGLGNVPLWCGIYVRWVLTWCAHYELFWTLPTKPRLSQNCTSSMPSFSTYSTSCVFLYLCSDLEVLLWTVTQPRKGKMLHALVLRGRKQAGRSAEKIAHIWKSFVMGYDIFPRTLLRRGRVLACFFLAITGHFCP